MRDEITESVDVDIVLIIGWIQLIEAPSKCGWSSFMLARNTFNNNLDAYYYYRQCALEWSRWVNKYRIEIKVKQIKEVMY